VVNILGRYYAFFREVANSSENSKGKSGLTQISPSRKPGLGIILGIFSIIALVSLLDYDPTNFHTHPPSGDPPLMGQVGVVLARYTFALLGLSAWLLPWFLGVSSLIYFTPTTKKEKINKLIPFPFIALSICLLANIRDYSALESGNQLSLDQLNFEHGAGGTIGAWLFSGMPLFAQGEATIGGFFRIWIGEVGSLIFAICLLISALAMHFSFGKEKFLRFFTVLRKLLNRFPVKNSPAKKKPEEVNKQTSNENRSEGLLKAFFSSKRLISEDPLFGDVSKQDSEFKENALNSVTRLETKKPHKKEESPVKVSSGDEAKNDSFVNDVSEGGESAPSDLADVKIPDVALNDGFKVVRAEKTEKATDLFPERKGDYHFPTLDLLMEPPEITTGGDEDHMVKASRLKETLAEFKIDVELGEVHTGPVITRYDIHPAAGVRVEKIANLDKNLAMALRADSVRILAPVPGKGCVGIEVPNDISAPVCLKEILQSKAWADANAEIPIVLGKEASGKPLVADLTKMPHLLVAGSTGSGKTVCINAIIASLCYHSSPDDVRFIMVDPKIVEMKVYNDLPHMLIPVVTEPKKVPGALKWLLVEMERRYQIFSKIGVRNIAGFNAKILKDKEEKEKAQLLDAEMTAEERAALSSIQVPRDDEALEIPENKLPYIVCIIDELADLMMVAQADVETGIARLAQLARAAGIHLIIATQRPSVNVITGVIKANLPSRISFRVASYRDSQTILDGKGAESLIGKGDMLFIPPGSATFMRAQGAFVSDDEINGIVDYLKVNGPPQIIEEVREQIESAGEDDVLGSTGDNDDEDPMLKKAIEIIRTTKRASTSNLQRKLSIGYNRAARIMDELEDRGVVGPDMPGQGREILLDF
jgi:S-DNA-T family DNA segregation ATPase FtsK/SpoIIIE